VILSCLTIRFIVKVYFIDNGCYGQVEAKKLSEMPPLLMGVPSLAIHCSLNHVIPLNEEWSEQCLEFFSRLFLGKVVTITIQVIKKLCDVVHAHMMSCDVGHS